MGSTSAAGANPGRNGPVIERRSIDYVPLAERRGTVWHQGPFWFGGNFILLTLAAGFLGPSLGLSTGWCIAAIVIGVGFGTFFMAFHANQGPHLGLPQMIQSRAQLGMYGAVFSLSAAALAYMGLIIFNVILAAEVVQLKLPGSNEFWYPAIVGLAVLIAIVGHDLLHVVERWISFIIVVFYTIFTLYAIFTLSGGAAPLVPATAAPAAGFNWSAFLTVLSVGAGYQISYAIYVSDYSRYLPSNVPARPLITWTYVGAAGSAIWLMSLGAFLGNNLGIEDAVQSVVQVGNRLYPGFGTFMIYASLPSLIGIIAVNSYGAMLSSASAIDGFVRLKPTLRLRVVSLIVIGAVCVFGALAIPEDFLGAFNDFITVILYLLIPWSAVNLIDYYFVRRGHYIISEIFNRDGIYGKWPWRGVLSYLIGILAMLPFVKVFGYTGPVARAMGDVDFSFVIGLFVSGGLYYVLYRNYDIQPEIELAKRRNQELDAMVSGQQGGSPSH